jgi:hypothetical protein
MTNLSYLESGVTQVKQERCLLQALVEDACKSGCRWRRVSA